MAEQPQSGWLKRFAAHNAKVIYTAALASLVASVASILATVAIYRGAKHEGVEIPAGATPPIVVMMQDAPPAVDYTPTTGWVPDATVIQDNRNEFWTDQFDATPAGRAALGDEDVFLWPAINKVAGKPAQWVNQMSVGCCVGCGFKHAADLCQAMQILNGKRAEWKALSVEVIYGNSRVLVGGGRISGDGSVGAWAKEAIEKYGVAPMEQVNGVDLSAFSPARAREWGRSGVPATVNDVARQHPVKGSALVKSWPDVKRAIQQGYPVAVCSNQGFTMERDSTGRCRPQGSWNHCMAIIGVRSGPNEGAFILNSWGDRAHTGPVWPADAPVAGFWADAAVIDRMVRQGDSFALSDMTGFAARRVPLDWFIVRPTIADPFAHRGAMKWLAA